jgi:hypothetical protein
MGKLQILLIAIVAILFTGCVKQAFVIKTSEDDKFADKSTTTLSGQNNRVSDKSIQGGIHVNEEGLYIEPTATIKKGYKPHISFVAFHYGSISVGSLVSAIASDKDSFRPIVEMIFLVNGNERIVVKMTPRQTTFGKTIYNTTFHEAYQSFAESSIGEIDIELFKKLSNAKTIDVKAVGGQYSQTYDNNELEKDFISNFKQFYEKVLEYDKKIN